jgi:hypothetical protein
LPDTPLLYLPPFSQMSGAVLFFSSSKPSLASGQNWQHMQLAFDDDGKEDKEE